MMRNSPFFGLLSFAPVHCGTILYAQPVDLGQLFRGKGRVLHGFDVIQNLARAGSADQHARDLLLRQQLGQRHFGQRLAARGGKVIQLGDAGQQFGRQVAFF